MWRTLEARTTGKDPCANRCSRLPLGLALALGLGLVAPPAGAITAFVTGTVTEIVSTGDVPFPDAEIGDAFQVTIEYAQRECGSDPQAAICTHNLTFYQETIEDVVMTVDGETVDLGGGATGDGVLIQNDVPGDRIEISSLVLLREGSIDVVLAGGAGRWRPPSRSSRAAISARCRAGIRASPSSLSGTRPP